MNHVIAGAMQGYVWGFFGVVCLRLGRLLWSAVALWVHRKARRHGYVSLQDKIDQGEFE